jgi:prepilin-type processing-associated H-X9-DG protein
VPDWHVFQSPFDQRTMPASTSPQNVSYGYNNEILNPTAANFNPTSSALHFPSGLMLFGPVCTLHGTALSFIGTSGANTSVAPGGAAGLMGSFTMLNAVFLDGHVTKMKATDFNNSAYNPSSGNSKSEFWDPTAY